MTPTELREKSLSAAHEGRALLNTIKDDNSNFAEVTEQFERCMRDSDAFAARAEAMEQTEARDRAFDQIVTNVPATGERHTNDTDEKRAEAFGLYLRGEKTLSEVRAMGVNTDSKGGALVPTSFINKLITRLRTEGPMLDPTVVNYITTETGNDIEMPTFDDSARATIIGENTAIPEVDLAFGTKTLGAFKYTSGIVRVSNELLQDAAVDAEGVISGALGRRVGRGLNEDLTNGNGTDAPEGIATAASAMTAALTNAVAAEELFALQHAIDPAYRQNAKWMFSDAFLLKVRTMKDGNGNWMWAPGMTVGAPASVLDRPYVINPYLSSEFTTGKTVALFGDFKAYTVRQVLGIYVKRMGERYGEYDQVGFASLARYDGRLLDTSAVKALKLA